MTNYSIAVSEPAEAEMEDAFYYSFLRSPEAATRLRDSFDQAIETLSQMPPRCPFAPENERLDRPIRQLLHRHGNTPTGFCLS